jgi:alkanesulfonate monooxygenase SsuD/methylene tetrahydromethanopterin reductase-like flavin-dependent oxidoreductase (luciferase family)
LAFCYDKVFAGKHQDAPFLPRTVQKPHPPLLIGGQGPKLILPGIARHANIWHLRVREIEPEQVQKLCTTFDDVCRKIGRNPAEIEKAISLRSAQLSGPTDELRRQIHTLSGIGIRHFTISLAPEDRQYLSRFATEVMPAFRET